MSEQNAVPPCTASRSSNTHIDGVTTPAIGPTARRWWQGSSAIPDAVGEPPLGLLGVAASPSNSIAPISAPRSGPDARSQSIGGPACRNCPRSQPERLAGRAYVDQLGARARASARPRCALASARRGSASTRGELVLGARRAAAASRRASTGDRLRGERVGEQVRRPPSPPSAAPSLSSPLIRAHQRPTACRAAAALDGKTARRPPAAPPPGGRGPAGRRPSPNSDDDDGRVAASAAIAGASSRRGRGARRDRARRRAARRRGPGRRPRPASRSSRRLGSIIGWARPWVQLVVAEVDHQMPGSRRSSPAPSRSSGMFGRDRTERLGAMTIASSQSVPPENSPRSVPGRARERRGPLRPGSAARRRPRAATASAAAVRSGWPGPSSASRDRGRQVGRVRRATASATSGAGGFDTTTISSVAGSAASRSSACSVDRAADRRGEVPPARRRGSG